MDLCRSTTSGHARCGGVMFERAKELLLRAVDSPNPRRDVHATSDRLAKRPGSAQPKRMRELSQERRMWVDLNAERSRDCGSDQRRRHNGRRKLVRP